jgi:D-alanyl-D-alanine carboxypeptidase
LTAVRRLVASALFAVALAVVVPAAEAATEPPPVDASAYLVTSPNTGETLAASRANRRLAIASITKVMTALVTLERTDPDDMVQVSPVAVGVGEATVNLRVGERLTVRELLAAVLIQSANDAAWALAAHVGRGSIDRFVGYMNERARELGLRNTHYERPDGLDTSNHFSSARDQLRLARAAMRRPLFRELVRTKRMRISGGRLLETTNDLLSTFPGTIGVKTGFTSDAGWSEVAQARRRGITVAAVLLGGPSRGKRNADLAGLLDWGFSQLVRVQLVSPLRTYATAAIPFSDERVRLVAEEPADAVVRLGPALVERVVAVETVDPPVEQGDRLGEVCVDAGEREVCRRLVAAADVEAPSLGARIGWYAGRALDQAGGMLESIFGAIF